MFLSITRLRTAGAIVALTLLVIGFPIFSYRAEMNHWNQTFLAAKQIRTGMTSDEITVLMGQPTRRLFSSDGDSFIYEPFYILTRLGLNPWRLRWKPYVQILFARNQVEHTHIYPDKDIPFDPEDWRRAWSSRRGCMVRDMLRRVSFQGKTKAEIIALLGKPDREVPKSNLMCYDLGHFLRKGFDPDLMYVYVDEENRFERLHFVW